MSAWKANRRCRGLDESAPPRHRAMSRLHDPVDHVDDAVRLIDIGDGYRGGVSLVVGEHDALALAHCSQGIALDSFEHGLATTFGDHPVDVAGGDPSGDDMI